MVAFDLMVGLAIIKQMLRDKLRQIEEKSKVQTKRRALMDYQGRISIEHSIKMPRFQYKTVVVLSARGFGRRHILQTLVRRHPEKYGIPTMHTSRAPKPQEICGNRYTFVTHRQMMLDYRGRKFLEYGLSVNDHYGIKFDSVRSIIRDGKLALLEIDPMSLRFLRNPEFAPFVIFIAPPTVQNGIDFEGILARMNYESDQIKREYDHLINMSIEMNNIPEIIDAMEVVLKDIVQSPQWVPITWVREHRRR